MFSYQEALDYLYSFIDYGTTRPNKYASETFDLGRMARFLDLMGNPHRRYPALHLAGTKGKGSVAAMCASALAAAGYRAGFYTSPHLLDFCERAQINGRLIPPAEVADIVTRLRDLVQRVPEMTTFELTTAMAFEWFARQQVDVAVVEVGLGGRLDATNVIVPRVSVITSLSYDHTYLLGDTLTQIAGEKAGIIKPGVPVVAAPQVDEARVVLERVAAERGAPLIQVGRDWLFRPLAHSLAGQSFEIWSAEQQRQLDALRAQGHAVAWKASRLEIPLLGAHQVENAAVAYAALMALRDSELPIAADAIHDGLRAVQWPGRFEVLRTRPAVVVDGAHNRDSARKLRTALDDYFPGRRVTLLFGASADKDVTGMLAELLPRAARVILTQAVHPRALEPGELALMCGGFGGPVEQISPVARAYEIALRSAKPDDVILATGSLFVVAETQAAAQRVAAA